LSVSPAAPNLCSKLLLLDGMQLLNATKVILLARWVWIYKPCFI